MKNTKNLEEKISDDKFEILIVAFDELKNIKKIFSILKYTFKTISKTLKNKRNALISSTCHLTIT